MAQLQKFHSVRDLESRERDLRHSHTGRTLNLQLEYSEGLARFIQLRSDGCVPLRCVPLEQCGAEKCRSFLWWLSLAWYKHLCALDLHSA